MEVKDMNLNQLKQDIIQSAQRGYPIFIAGTLYWLVMGILNAFLEDKLLALIYILASGSIFPLGILLSRLLKVNFISKHNPLGKVGGQIAGIQGFYIPVYILIYMYQPEWVPFFIGMLAAAHFLPYSWIYNSKAYYFQTFGMYGISAVIGFGYPELTFTVFPFLIAFIYAGTTILLLLENRKDAMLASESRLPG